MNLMPSDSNDLLYQIGLNEAYGVGPKTARQLIAELGSAREIYEASRTELQRVERITKTAVEAILSGDGLKRAEAELRWLESQPVKPLWYLDPGYPRRLRHCDDAPVVLYQRGETDLNAQHILAVVGTRAATEYGRHFCEKLMEDLLPYHPLIVSGLAYGIDISAQRAALDKGLLTVGVLAHGVDTVYPHLHRHTAEEMEHAGGGLVSEFPSKTRPDRENFPQRNRIIAGMADATLVVEAGARGGALITADLAAGYHREVFALPGRFNDPVSVGCNKLIQHNKAALINSGQDLARLMGWEASQKAPPAQTQLFASLDEEQQKLFSLLEKNNEAVALEKLCEQLDWSVSQTLRTLMGLEINGLVRSLPGKRYAKQ
jgi:DNA processing protein